MPERTDRRHTRVHYTTTDAVLPVRAIGPPPIYLASSQDAFSLQ